MQPPVLPSDNIEHKERKPSASGAVELRKTWALVGLIVAFALCAHWAPGAQVFRSEVVSEPGWEQFRKAYRINHFGEDGQFVRAVQNGYNLVHHTHKYAPRFTRKTATDRVNACASCHSAKDLAYAFVNSDRFDAKLGKRVSFEDRVRRCYAGPMEGFVPTVYEPAVRDIRLLARAVAHHLQLSEGALADGGVRDADASR